MRYRTFRATFEGSSQYKGLVGLPHGIGVGRLSLIQQVKFFSVGCVSLVGEGYECRIKALDDLADTFITGRFPPLLSWDLHPLGPTHNLDVHPP